MACAICETRRPRRFCPGVRGNICAVCCGTEREVTVNCPFDCEYLREARRREKPEPVEEASVPNRDIRVSEAFVENNADLVSFLSNAVAGAAIESGAIDYDVREALEALIRTYRTLESGVYYESLPQNPLAANVFRAVREAAPQFAEHERRQLGVTRTRDADILRALVFLQRAELSRNNGRRRGRAFLDAIVGAHVEGEPDAGERGGGSPLIVP